MNTTEYFSLVSRSLSWLFLESLRVLVEVLLVELVGPVEERLSDHGADAVVVPAAAGLHDLRDEVVLPPPLTNQRLV